LLRAEALRRDLGSNARHEAMVRFSGVAFRQNLAAVYARPWRP
jgi:hypothetical protein